MPPTKHTTRTAVNLILALDRKGLSFSVERKSLTFEDDGTIQAAKEGT